MIKCNNLSLDCGTLMKGLKPYILQTFAEAEDKLLSLMEQEVMRTVHGNGPGKPEWRARVRDMLEVVEENLTDDFLEAKVGFDANALYTDFVKAMLIMDGAGSAAGGEPIKAGPPGRAVWDSDLSGKHPSKVLTEYDLPDAFNQPGNEFVQNAVRMMKMHYDSILEGLSASIPSLVFSSAVRVSAG